MGRGGPALGPRGAGGGEQPAEGGGAHPPDELGDLGRQPQFAVTGEPVEQFRHEGTELLRPALRQPAQR